MDIEQEIQKFDNADLFVEIDYDFLKKKAWGLKCLSKAKVKFFIQKILDIAVRESRTSTLKEVEGIIEKMKKTKNYEKQGAGVVIIDVYNQALSNLYTALQKLKNHE